MRLKCTPLILLFLLSFFSSCIDNANFDQIDLNAEPTFEAPLVFFELTQFDFLDDAGMIEDITIRDVSDLDFFQTSSVRDNLTRMDLIYTVQSEFDRGFTITTELLDISGNPTYTFQPVIFNAGSNSRDFRENIIIQDNQLVLSTTQIRFSVTLASNDPLDTSEERRIRLESMGIFYLRLE